MYLTIKKIAKKVLMIDTLRRFVFRCTTLRRLSDTHLKGGRYIFMATPIHGNLGDHAIVCAQKSFVRHIDSAKRIVEIANNEYTLNKNIISKHISKDDIIVIDGGGNLGTLWQHEDDKISEIIQTYQHNKIMVFPQTCFYDDTQAAQNRLLKNKAIYSKTPFLTVCLRDRASFDFFNEHFQGVASLFTPDIVLSLKHREYNLNRNGCLLILRKDKESVLPTNTNIDLESTLQDQDIPFSYDDTVVPYNVKAKQRNAELDKLLRKFASSRLVVTDRLHGMIFAAITGTPCLAIDNVSKKVSGVYSWIEYLDYIHVCTTHEELTERIAEFYGKGGAFYDNSTLIKHFERLRDEL